METPAGRISITATEIGSDARDRILNNIQVGLNDLNQAYKKEVENHEAQNLKERQEADRHFEAIIERLRDSLKKANNRTTKAEDEKELLKMAYDANLKVLGHRDEELTAVKKRMQDAEQKLKAFQKYNDVRRAKVQLSTPLPIPRQGYANTFEDCEDSNSTITTIDREKLTASNTVELEEKDTISEQEKKLQLSDNQHTKVGGTIAPVKKLPVIKIKMADAMTSERREFLLKSFGHMVNRVCRCFGLYLNLPEICKLRDIHSKLSEGCYETLHAFKLEMQLVVTDIGYIRFDNGSSSRTVREAFEELMQTVPPTKSLLIVNGDPIKSSRKRPRDLEEDEPAGKYQKLV